MSESGRSRGRRFDRAADRRSGDGLTIAVLAVCGGWLVFALAAMLASSSPDLGPIGGSAQHFALGVVLSIMIAAAIALVTNSRPATVAWAAVLLTGAALVVYELLQLAVPVRSFQWTDLSYGVSGVTIGGLVTLVGLRYRDGFTAGVAGFGGVALVLAAAGLVIVGEDELRTPVATRLVDCSEQNRGVAEDRVGDWSHRLLELSGESSGCVDGGVTNLVPFGAPVGRSETGVNLDRGGLVSSPLTGLGDAVSSSGAITFGVRFNSAVTTEDVVPVVLARLTVDGDPAVPITQLLQRGPHLTANVGSGRPIVGVGLPLAERANPGTVQELVVTYQAGMAAVYLDGQPISEAVVEPFSFVFDGELTLEVGWRIDERWQPFSGQMTALLIADRALTPEEITTAFEPRS